MLTALLIALTFPVAASAAAARTAAVAPAAAAGPARKPLAPVVINGVLYQAVEFDGDTAMWRNLAITVTAERLDAWRNLSAAQKSGYATLMIDTYRAGMKYDRDIKLSFIDEHGATLDQYWWVPPLPAKKYVASAQRVVGCGPRRTSTQR